MFSITRKRKPKQPPLVYASLDIDKAIGNSFRNEKKPLYTHCKITAHMGGHFAQLKANYFWDGASIPRFFWTLLGINPSDPRSMIASAFHDEGCDNPNTPQVLADATFVALLGPIKFNAYPLKGVGKWRARAMYAAVRFYSIFVRPLTRKRGQA